MARHRILKSKADLLLSIREDIAECVKAHHDALLEGDVPSHLLTNLGAQIDTLRMIEGRIMIWCADWGTPDPELELEDGLTKTERRLMSSGNKLQAIREVRERTRCGLAEAKCLVETWSNLHHKIRA